MSTTNQLGKLQKLSASKVCVMTTMA